MNRANSRVFANVLKECEPPTEGRAARKTGVCRPGVYTSSTGKRLLRPSYKVQFLFVAFLLACCTRCDSFVQENSCQIESYIRKQQGTSPGNLLRVHLDVNNEPVAISFNGTCNDSTTLTEFILAKKDSGGKLVVNIHWKANRTFVLGMDAGGLVIERANVSTRHVFRMMDTPKNCRLICHIAFKSFSSAQLYMMTNIAGLPLVGKNPSERGTWYDVMSTFCGV